MFYEDKIFKEFYKTKEEFLEKQKKHFEIDRLNSLMIWKKIIETTTNVEEKIKAEKMVLKETKWLELNKNRG